MTAPPGGSAPASRRRARAAPRGEAGFTLLEILVALAVLGFLVVGLTQGTRFGLRAWDRQARLIGERGDLDAVDRVLRRLVEQMDPGSRQESPRVLGSARALEFTTDLGPAAGALGTREADVRLSAENGRLLLRWRPHLHAVRLGPPPPPTDTELLRGLARLEIAYLDGSTWRDAWAERRLPELVRVRLSFPAGDARRWPDVVAAPLRERPDG